MVDACCVVVDASVDAREVVAVEIAMVVDADPVVEAAKVDEDATVEEDETDVEA